MAARRRRRQRSACPSTWRRSRTRCTSRRWCRGPPSSGGWSTQGRTPPQLLYDGVPQPLNIMALDGDPVGTPPAGAARPARLARPCARRAEIVFRGPDASVLDARLATLAVDTGPIGDAGPARPLVRILPRGNATRPVWRRPVPAVLARPLGQHEQLASTRSPLL